MASLDPKERRALRARAHHLRPQVAIGQQGLTGAVLHEIDVALTAHELVKIRVLSALRPERETLLARVCEALGAAAVQHVGKQLIVWRPSPEPDTSATPVAPPKPAKAARRRRRQT